MEKKYIHRHIQHIQAEIYTENVLSSEVTLLIFITEASSSSLMVVEAINKQIKKEKRK